LEPEILSSVPLKRTWLFCRLHVVWIAQVLYCLYLTSHLSLTYASYSLWLCVHLMLIMSCTIAKHLGGGLVGCLTFAGWVMNLKEDKVEELDAKIWSDTREGSYKSKWSSTMVVPSIRWGVWVGGLLLQSGIAHVVFDLILLSRHGHQPTMQVFEGLLNISVCLMSTVSGNWIFFSWLSGGTIWYSNLY
jgi:hypothetical protein